LDEPQDEAETGSGDESGVDRLIDPGLLEFLVEHRFINGTATMLMDLDRCVRCDDCVVACARAHDNNPRFNRHGRRHDHYMVANACMHCMDPVCMIGCPTGAIHRSSAGGQVVINDTTCIGCATCASSCPYDNIRMVEVRDASGAFIRDAVTNAPIIKATKCDLCLDQPGGPACQRACPHDALKRVDMQDLIGLGRWLNR
jgi:Fe-S-cluster-containing dehydrogenase component